ncbi:hypothetical protein DFA_06729 [Cavenderia fasciculata]|uniref:Uncharacterized protein n=1 Tax=Cavenderia fasciculata TaxID=261658 RepID=F4Q242_CACFS|nr:uncharacterized protein DFA_06729 [Cavenderia fasciculata]EGG18062.1 hypothetical protein DFA_06729 [Cavenderia fasciculata]|eukprot:XP_004356955.1 hypothetical protein DFA_06729 [Cavenderia fasciculata]
MSVVFGSNVIRPPGQWQSGISVKPQWNKPSFRSHRPQTKTLDLMRFSKALDLAYYTQISDILRTSSLCRLDQVQDHLKSIACSCNDGSDCFTTSTITIGQKQVCALVDDDYTFSFGRLLFSETSVPQACTNILVQTVPKKLLKSKATETLSSNFISYKKPDDFSIYNAAGAVVGKVLSDGIKVQPLGVKSFSICFKQDSIESLENQTDGLVVDFSTLENVTESSTVSQLRIMEKNITRHTIHSSDGVCIILTKL